MRFLTFAAPFFLFTAGTAVGQDIGDPAAGHALASAICADCHSIELGEAASPKPDAPAFQTVAKNPEMSELALTVFFQMPHPSMPNLIVTGDDARDLVAYILSLKP